MGLLYRWARRLPRRLGFEIQPWPSDQHILLEYPFKPRARVGSREAFAELINEERANYLTVLAGMREAGDVVTAIGSEPADDLTLPFWRNDYLPPQDALALVYFLRRYQPARYVEIGSGMSTRFARFTIDRDQLPTTITSIDPAPRFPIEQVADQALTMPLDAVDIGFFSTLVPGDIVALDGSHYTFPGSDVVIFFLEILPKLAPGVIIQVHDIFLPDDYPEYIARRYYSEQYMLANLLLFARRRMRIWLPMRFVAGDDELRATLPPLPHFGVDGASFWFTMQE